MLLPHINNSLIVWEHQLSKLTTLQKKCIRIITKSKMFAHKDLLFKNWPILKAEDIFKIQQFQLYYKYLKHTLPSFFLNHQFITSEHNHNTRNQDLYKCRIKHEFARQCLLYNIPDAINNCPTNIKEKYFTYSLQGIITYAKSSILNSYNSICHIPRCYVCSTIQ